MEISLKKTLKHGGIYASFSDLYTKLNDRQFSLSLLGKRDGFPFSIVRMQHISSNMPSNIFYSSIGAEILRIGADFVNSSTDLLERMYKQGAKIDRVHRTLNKIYCRHDILHKFGYNSKNNQYYHKCMLIIDTCFTARWEVCTLHPRGYQSLHLSFCKKLPGGFDLYLIFWNWRSHFFCLVYIFYFFSFLERTLFLKE